MANATTSLRDEIMMAFGPVVNGIVTRPFVTVLPKVEWRALIDSEIASEWEQRTMSVLVTSGKYKLEFIHLGAIAQAIPLDQNQITALHTRCEKRREDILQEQLIRENDLKFLNGFADCLLEDPKQDSINDQPAR